MITIPPKYRPILIRSLKLVLTFGILGLIVSQMNWRDRAILADGTEVIVLDRHGSEILVQSPSINEPTRLKKENYERIVPGVPSLLKSIRPAWFILAFTLHVAVQLILAVRWRVLLSVTPGQASLYSTTIWLPRSQALATLPIGQLGIDAIRAYQATNSTRSLSFSLSVLIVERILGFVVLMALASAGLCQLVKADGAFIPDLKALATSIGLLLIGAVISLWLGYLLVAKYPSSRLGQAITRMIEQMRLCISRLYHRPGTVTASVLLTMIIHLLTISVYIAIDHGLTLQGGWSLYLFAIPVMNFITCIPDLGVGSVLLFEGSMAAMLTTLGNLAAHQAIALCAVMRVIGLLYRPIPVTALWLRPAPSLENIQEKSTLTPLTEGGMADVACA